MPDEIPQAAVAAAADELWQYIADDRTGRAELDHAARTVLAAALPELRSAAIVHADTHHKRLHHELRDAVSRSLGCDVAMPHEVLLAHLRKNTGGS